MNKECNNNTLTTIVRVYNTFSNNRCSELLVLLQEERMGGSILILNSSAKSEVSFHARTRLAAWFFCSFLPFVPTADVVNGSLVRPLFVTRFTALGGGERNYGYHSPSFPHARTPIGPRNKENERLWNPIQWTNFCLSFG